jgi:hypothetical protein
VVGVSDAFAKTAESPTLSTVVAIFEDGKEKYLVGFISVQKPLSSEDLEVMENIWTSQTPTRKIYVETKRTDHILTRD